MRTGRVVENFQDGAVGFAQFAGYVQAQAGAAGVGGEEGFEHLHPQVGCDTAAVVDDVQFAALAVVADTRLDAYAAGQAGALAQGIGEQVPEHPIEVAAIEVQAQIGRFDQDLRFASEGIKDSFYLVQLLEASGYDGPRHFDAHPYRMEDAAGVWEFAAGCMRTYLVLAEKARQFGTDPEIQAALETAGVPDLGKPTVGTYSAPKAQELLAAHFDLDGLARRGYANERLDQLVVDLLLGTR